MPLPRALAKLENSGFHSETFINNDSSHARAGEALDALEKLMAFLRSPEGCPWDRAQNYDSIKRLVLEEAYEVVDAVRQKNFDGLEDELGDLLFQVVFYARLAEEDGHFDLASVIRRVHEKLVRRHPHVFQNREARDAEEALKSWEQVKDDERKAKGLPQKPPSALDGIGKSLPAALEAYQVGVRAAEQGFDWRTADEILAKVEEEIAELRQELAAKQPERNRLEEEAGDLMFATANLARFLGYDAETCLRSANRKFQKRFRALEQTVVSRGKKMRDLRQDELDAIWNEIKKGSEADPG